MLVVELWVGGPLLREALSRSPGTTVSGDEQYISADVIRVLFWAEGDDLEAFDDALAFDPTFTDPTCLAETDRGRLYRVTLTEAASAATTLSTWRDLDLVLLDAIGTQNGWTIRIRVPDRDSLAQFRHALQDRELSFRVTSLYHVDEAGNAPHPLLTEAQYEALVTAYESGYFDVPRTASQADLAARLQVTPQAVSERLRRATAALVRSTLLAEPP